MITLQEARDIFQKMIDSQESKYNICEIWEIDYDDPIYVMTVIDESGYQLFPGEVFQSIRKKDGKLVDFSFPCPA